MEDVIQPTEVTENPVGEQPSESPELGELKAKLKELEENFKNEQRISSKKELELQRFQQVIKEKENDDSTLKSLIAMMAQQQNQPEDEFGETLKKRQPDLLKEYERLEGERKKRKYLEEFNQEVNKLWNDALSLGLTEKDDDYFEIWDKLKVGSFKSAEIQINKLKKTKETSIPKTKKTVDELTDEEKAEIAREVLEKQGKLKTSISTPSGGVGSGIPTDINIYREWVSNLSQSEYEKLKPKIDEMKAAGKIK